MKIVKSKSLLLGSLLLVSAAAVADDSDQEFAKRLRDSGDIVSLEALLADVRSRHSGRVLEVELEYEHGQYVYEIEMVDDQGEVREFYYNAKDGQFLNQLGGEADDGKEKQ